MRASGMACQRADFCAGVLDLSTSMNGLIGLKQGLGVSFGLHSHEESWAVGRCLTK